MTELQMNIDFPHADAKASAWLEVSGWACGANPVVSVHAKLEGSLAQCHCLFGQPRPDVAAAFPSSVHAAAGGFIGYLPLDGISGPVSLVVTVTDNSGAKIQQRRALSVVDLREGEPSGIGPCPVCGTETLPMHPVVQRGPYVLHRCPTCSLGRVVPQPEIEALKRYYDDRYWQNSPAACSPDTEHSDTPRFDSLLREYLKPGASILEMGCGPGYLMNGLRRRGFRIEGQDYSSTAARFAMEKFGLNVSVGPIQDAPTGPFDAVILRHVIEHSPEPGRDLAAIANRLAPGGVALLVTPNLDSIGFQALGSAWEWFVPPAHLHYFSAQFFDYASRQFGLECVMHDTRRGDAASVAISCAAVLHAEPRILPAHRERIARSICERGEARFAEVDAWAGTLGLGSEITVVLQKRS